MKRSVATLVLALPALLAGCSSVGLGVGIGIPIGRGGGVGVSVGGTVPLPAKPAEPAASAASAPR
jgi:hypothetical protein